MNDPLSIILSGVPKEMRLMPVDEALIASVALQRTERMNSRRNPLSDLGSQYQNIDADKLGLRAEVAVIRLMEQNGLQPAYVLLSEGPINAPDIVVSGFTYDVKATVVRTGRNTYLTINAKKHRTLKVGMYIPVVILGSGVITVCLPVPYAEVSLWDLRNDRHAPYYSAPVRALMRSLPPARTEAGTW